MTDLPASSASTALPRNWGTGSTPASALTSHTTQRVLPNYRQRKPYSAYLFQAVFPECRFKRSFGEGG